MEKQQIRARASIKKKGVHVTADIQLIEYQEDGFYFVSSPALNVVGCGTNITEARKSFEITFQEVVEYAIVKKTLLPYLKKMGWHIKGKEFKTLTPPSLSSLVRSNKELEQLFDVNKIHVVPRTISIPIPQYL